MDNPQTPFVEPPPVAQGFALAEFAENPEPRCPCLLLLDTSGSMGGAPISQLNEGLATFQDELAADAIASQRVEIAVVTFGPVKTEMDFTPAAHFTAPRLVASGDTPMGAAIVDGIARLESRKDTYRANGISYYRPWIFLITDGSPTDDVSAAAQSVRDGEAAGKFLFFGVGVRDADMAKLGQISPVSRPPVMLDGLRFRDLFLWLSKSMRGVSSSAPGSSIQLTAPGWISAST